MIYPTTAVSAVPTSLPTVDKPSVIADKVANGHVRKPSWKRGLPPVPPLPKNAHTLRPVFAISGRPLSSARIGRGIPVELPSLYPNLCPCMFHLRKRGQMLTSRADPPVYPHLVIYPAVASKDTSIKVDLAGKVLAVSQYPHLVICKHAVFASAMDSNH